MNQRGLLIRLFHIFKAWRNDKPSCPRCEDMGFYRAYVKNPKFNALYPDVGPLYLIEWEVCDCDEGFFYTPCKNPKFKPARKGFLSL